MFSGIGWMPIDSSEVALPGLGRLTGRGILVITAQNSAIAEVQPLLVWPWTASVAVGFPDAGTTHPLVSLGIGYDVYEGPAGDSARYLSTLRELVETPQVSLAL